jgi:hypothetical protein
MENQERQQKISQYGHAHATLTAAIQQFPREMWQFKPSPADFSIHEIIVHIADSEANSYARCRRAIAEPGSTVMAYDEMRWAAALDYHRQDPDEALELFKWLRRLSYHLIRDLPAEAWSRTIHHPENGLMTLDDWLDVYARHIPEHIAQMQGVYAAWKAATAPA